MARSLMDNVKKQLEGPGEQPGMTDEGAKAQTLLRAKLGKAGTTGTTPRRSSIQEQQAVQQSRLGAKQQQQQGEVAAEGIQQKQEQQRVQEEEAQANIFEKRKDLKQSFELQSENILNDLERHGQEMSAKEKIAKMEQLGFMVRLSNEQYVHQLQMEGERNRLDNDLSFREAATRTAFAEEQALLEDKVSVQKIMDMDAREYEEALANISTRHAYELSRKDDKIQKKKDMYEGISKSAAASTDKGGPFA